MSTEQIRALNDQLRTTLKGSLVILSDRTCSLPTEQQARIVYLLRNYDAFTEQTDPDGEHRQGAFRVEGSTVKWYINYYKKYLGRRKQNTAPLDPSNPFLTTRILAVCVAGEYREMLRYHHRREKQEARSKKARQSAAWMTACLSGEVP